MILLLKQRKKKSEKMKEITIVKRKISNNDYIIFPDSYINPLANLSLFEKELINNIGISCQILVDLLLCNGDNFNRFVSLEFNGSNIDRSSIRIITLNATEQKDVNEFYKKNKNVISKGVLVSSEYMTYIR